MKNWKTTVVGIIGALTTWLPQLKAVLESNQPVNWGTMGIGLVILLLGVCAKDLDVTGGTRGQ